MCAYYCFSLVPKRNCVDVPKEVCSRARRNPRKVNRPVIKKWCYVPSQESGLLREAKAADPVADTLSAETLIDVPAVEAVAADEVPVVAKVDDEPAIEIEMEASE